MPLLFPACATTPVETFRTPANATVDEAFVRSDADFSRYRKLRIVPLEVYFSEGQGLPNPEVVDRIRGIFRASFLEAIGDDYPLVDAAGPDVLGVRGSLVDLKHSPAVGTLPLQGRSARLVANGQLTFFMELTDSETGRVLARAADREEPPTTPEITELDAAWAATEREARRWAGLFRGFLDRNLTRP